MKRIFSISSVLLCALVISTACTNQTQKSSSEPTTQASSSDDISVEEYFDKLLTKVDKVTKDNYKSDDYKIYDYKTVLREPEKFFSLKMRIDNLEIVQIFKEGKYTKMLVTQPSGDFYMLFMETKRIEKRFLEKDHLTVNGRYSLSYEYTTNSNKEKSVPLIYVDAYLLLKN